jgi:hypothetical protein
MVRCGRNAVLKTETSACSACASLTYLRWILSSSARPQGRCRQRLAYQVVAAVMVAAPPLSATSTATFDP